MNLGPGVDECDERFRNIVFRAGLTPTEASGPDRGQSLLTHNDFVYKYTGTAATPGEIVYVMFPQPVRLLQLKLLSS